MGLRDAERLLDVLIVESLGFLLGDFFLPGIRVLDLGTGAGVPGILSWRSIETLPLPWRASPPWALLSIVQSSQNQ
jgi:hypothetical protein